MEETTLYISQMDNKLNAVYAYHMRNKLMEFIQQDKPNVERTLNLTEELNLHFERLLNEANDEDIIKNWKKELKYTSIPKTIQDMYSLKVCCVDWRETELKTEKWKKKIFKMVKSMLLVEDWFIKKHVS